MRVTTRSTRARWGARCVGLGLTTALAVALGAGPAAADPGEQFDAEVAPREVGNNPNCDDIVPELDFVHEADTENEPTDETLAFTVNGQQGSVIIDVTSTNMEGEPLRFDFSVTGPFAVAAVIVKGGPANDPTTGANLYDYRTTPAGQVEADETLHAQLNPNGTAYTGISHVAFCMVEDGAQT